MPDDRRVQIARLIADASYAEMSDIAESLFDFDTDSDRLLGEQPDHLGLASMLHGWASLVVESTGETPMTIDAAYRLEQE